MPKFLMEDFKRRNWSQHVVLECNGMVEIYES